MMDRDVGGLKVKYEGTRTKDILALSKSYKTTLESHPTPHGSSPKHFFKDEDSHDWLVSDTHPLTPINVYGDGNCLPRCASLLVYGQQNCHDERRIRIVTKFALNIDRYLDRAYFTDFEDFATIYDIGLY